MDSAQQRERLILAQTYAGVFGTPDGQRILEDLDRQFGGNPFDATNPHMTDYRCGAAAAVGYILQQIATAQTTTTETRQETA